MSSSEQDIEELLGPSQEERRIIRRNIKRLEELKERIVRRLAQLHLALGDSVQERESSLAEAGDSPSRAPMAKTGARGHIVTILNAAEGPLTRAEVIKRLEKEGQSYRPATVHLYLTKLIEGGEVVQVDAPPDSKSRYAYVLKDRDIRLGQ